MKNSVAWVALATLLASQPALAAKPQPIPQPVAPTLPIEVRLTQQEIRVDVPDNGAIAVAAAGGGLLGALIGAAINQAAAKKGETRVVELRNTLLDYDFNANVEAALRDVDFSPLSADPQLRLLTTSLAADWEAGQLKPEEYILEIAPDYAVTNDFESMTVAMNVMLVGRETKRNGKIKQVPRDYFRRYVWTYRLPPVRGANAEEDAARLVAMGKDQLVAMLDKGIVEVIDMLEYDMTADAAHELTNRPKGRTPSHELGGVKLTGYKLSGDEDELVVRNRQFGGITGVQVVDPSTPFEGVAAAAVADVAGATDAAMTDAATAEAAATTDAAGTTDVVMTTDASTTTAVVAPTADATTTEVAPAAEESAEAVSGTAPAAGSP